MSNLKLPNVTNYWAAVRELAGKYQVKIGYATYLRGRSDGSIAVIHHDTEIIRYHKCGKLQVTTGGWATRTTTNRLNRLTPDTVHIGIERGHVAVTTSTYTSVLWPRPDKSPNYWHIVRV